MKKKASGNSGKPEAKPEAKTVEGVNSISAVMHLHAPDERASAARVIATASLHLADAINHAGVACAAALQAAARVMDGPRDIGSVNSLADLLGKPAP